MVIPILRILILVSLLNFISNNLLAQENPKDFILDNFCYFKNRVIDEEEVEKYRVKFDYAKVDSFRLAKVYKSRRNILNTTKVFYVIERADFSDITDLDDCKGRIFKDSLSDKPLLKLTEYDKEIFKGFTYKIFILRYEWLGAEVLFKLKDNQIQSIAIMSFVE